VLLVAAVFWLTLHMYGERAAVFAGFAVAASLLIARWSHRSASDLGVATCCTLSLAALWVSLESMRPGGWRTLTLLSAYFFAGLGMLYKMPMPLVCVGLPAILYVVFWNRWRLLLNPWHLAGLVIFLMPWAPWVLATMQLESAALSKWHVEFLQRFTGELENVKGQDGLWWYFYYLPTGFLYTAPFSLSVIPAVVRAFRSPPGTMRDGSVFLLLWFFGLLMFFTASVGKEQRYFLPALPPLFVLLGRELGAIFSLDACRARLLRLSPSAFLPMVVFGVIASIVAGGYGVRAWWKARGQFDAVELAPLLWDYGGVAGTFGLAAILSAWLYSRMKPNTAFGVLVAGTGAAWMLTWAVLMPRFLTQNGFRDIAQQMREQLTPEQRDIARYLGTQDSRVIWYGDLRIPRLIDQLDLLTEQGGTRSLEYETAAYAVEMTRRLNEDPLSLFVAGRADYMLYRDNAAEVAGEMGVPAPPVYLWLQSRCGSKATRVIVFGNRPPPWPEPGLEPPREGHAAPRSDRFSEEEWRAALPLAMQRYGAGRASPPARPNDSQPAAGP
jgi:4-amino-4-deoxy-L-arabinose transferase-like glycosyltransferase